MNYPESNREIDDLDKQLFAEEFQHLADYITLDVPEPTILPELPNHDGLPHVPIEVSKAGFFMINGARVTLETKETLEDFDDWLENDFFDDPCISKAWAATVEAAPIVLRGIETVIEDFYVVEYIGDGEWYAQFERLTLSADSKDPSKMSIRTNTQIEQEEFLANNPSASSSELHVRRQQIVEDMEENNSDFVLSKRFTNKRFNRIMTLLGQLGPQHLLIDLTEDPEGRGRRTSR